MNETHMSGVGRSQDELLLEIQVGCESQVLEKHTSKIDSIWFCSPIAEPLKPFHPKVALLNENEYLQT